MRRSERIAAMTRILTRHPGEVLALGHFCDLFGVARSSVSEDLSLIRDALAQNGLGQVETSFGPNGGVRYLPHTTDGSAQEFLEMLCVELRKPERIIPGGFLFLGDILFHPRYAAEIGELFATQFASLEPQYVLTVETKGIPLALMTAHALNAPLLIARRDARVTEGPVVSINYVTGSARRIQTMSLSKRALPAETRVLIIDDFMKAGGSAQGMVELVLEFGAKPVGIGVLIETSEPQQKVVSEYTSLLTLEEVDERIRTVRLHRSHG